VRAFKGFDVAKDGGLSCRGFKYELGATYEHEGKVKLCEGGFHACARLADIECYYSDKSSWHEVELGGEIVSGGGKSAASRITVLRKLTPRELHNICGYGYSDGDGNGYGNGYGDDDGNGCGYGYGLHRVTYD
jgi:hypothetical protein